jgi:hypothetical protein
MPPPHSELHRRAIRWLVPAAALALVPKCLLCVLAYAGLGATLGLGGREICGVPSGSPGSWTPSLALPGAALLVVGAWATRTNARAALRRSRSSRARRLPSFRAPAGDRPICAGESRL